MNLSLHNQKLFSEELIKEIQDFGVTKTVTPGEQLIDYGQEIKHIPLLIDGAIKIMRQDKEGDELLLYFLETGDTCTFTLNWGVHQRKSEIRAEAETESKLILLPVAKMNEWIEKYPSWRQFVYQSFSTRFDEMLEAIDTLAFMNMHERVLKYLKDKAMVIGDDNLNLTHHDIALDLHTSRVVVSRIVKRLEKEGHISLFRNLIQLHQL